MANPDLRCDITNLPENKVAKTMMRTNAKSEALAGVGVADLDQNTRAE
jgi:hypothetical protein